VPASIAAEDTDVATQAPQVGPTGREGGSNRYVGLCRLLRASGYPGRRLSTSDRTAAAAVDAFPVYGGPWYDSGQPEGFAAQLGAFFVMMLVVSWGGWLLWRGSRAGAIVAVVTIPVEALFWYGFALPIPPLLTLVRVALVIAASMRPKSPCARQTASPGPNAGTEGILYDDVSRAGARNGDSYRR
jgi:hypothetical protein